MWSRFPVNFRTDFSHYIINKTSNASAKFLNSQQLVTGLNYRPKTQIIIPVFAPTTQCLLGSSAVWKFITCQGITLWFIYPIKEEFYSCSSNFHLCFSAFALNIKLVQCYMLQNTRHFTWYVCLYVYFHVWFASCAARWGCIALWKRFSQEQLSSRRTSVAPPSFVHSEIKHKSPKRENLVFRLKLGLNLAGTFFPDASLLFPHISESWFSGNQRLAGEYKIRVSGDWCDRDLELTDSQSSRKQCNPWTV